MMSRSICGVNWPSCPECTLGEVMGAVMWKDEEFSPAVIDPVLDQAADVGLDC